jgi:hypothetical protein
VDKLRLVEYIGRLPPGRLEQVIAGMQLLIQLAQVD